MRRHQRSLVRTSHMNKTYMQFICHLHVITLQSRRWMRNKSSEEFFCNGCIADCAWLGRGLLVGIASVPGRTATRPNNACFEREIIASVLLISVCSVTAQTFTLLIDSTAGWFSCMINIRHSVAILPCISSKTPNEYVWVWVSDWSNWY